MSPRASRGQCPPACSPAEPPAPPCLSLPSSPIFPALWGCLWKLSRCPLVLSSPPCPLGSVGRCSDAAVPGAGARLRCSLAVWESPEQSVGAEGREQRPCSQRQAWHDPSTGCLVTSLLRGFPRQQLALGSGATRLSVTACPCVCQHLPIASGTLLGRVGPSPWVPAVVGAQGISQGEVLVLRDICCSDVCSQRRVEVPLPGLVKRFAARDVQPANCQMLR